MFLMVLTDDASATPEVVIAGIGEDSETGKTSGSDDNNGDDIIVIEKKLEGSVCSTY